jgi:hypothetical protein
VSARERLAALLLGREIATAALGVEVPAGVRVRANRLVPALGGLGAGMRGPAAAVTLGGTILVHPSVRLDAGLLVHELAHVEQWRADPLFPLRYLAEWLRHGYRGNRYEVEAYARERSFRSAHTNTPGDA